MINKNSILQLKETIFYYIFLYGYFDLDLMRNINIFFDNLIEECNLRLGIENAEEIF